MSHRYKVRIFSSGDGDGQVTAGTIVQAAIDRSFSIQALNSEEVEKAIQSDVAKNKLPKGRVYQVCPQFGNPESVRSFAISVDGSTRKAILEPAKGIYSEFQRIRYEDARKEVSESEVFELQIAC